MPRFSLPIRRRRRRYRVVNRRRFYLAQGVLALTVAVALGLSASVIIRSIRTARLNRELVALYGVSSDAMEAQIAAPPMENQAFTARAEPVNSSPYGELSAMVMPDGARPSPCRRRHPFRRKWRTKYKLPLFTARTWISCRR